MNNPIRRIIETLKQGREAEYGMLGVAFTPLTLDSTTSERLTVAQAFRGGPAANAGVASGDVITRVNDRPVNDVDALQLAVGAQPPASTITVGYTRAGQPGTASVTLAKLAVAGKTIAASRPKPWLGIRVDYATALEANELPQAVMSDAFDPQGCVVVTDVEENSVAWKAGVRKGMYISHAGGKRVSTPDEFRAATEKLGDKFDIRLTQPIEPGATKK
jgi:S1-C subfamily serine protease